MIRAACFPDARVRDTTAPSVGPQALNWFLRGWTALVFVFLYVPIAVLVVYSFNSSRLNIVWERFTFDWYSKLFANGPLIKAAKNSLIIATGSTVLSVVIGTVGAWLLHRYRYRFSQAIQTLVAIPMVMPEILMGISLLILFATIGLQLGFVTVIIGHVTFSFPFVLVAVQARLQGLDPALEEAALDLGATPLKAFWLVIVPCLKPGHHRRRPHGVHAVDGRAHRHLLHPQRLGRDAAHPGLRPGPCRPQPDAQRAFRHLHPCDRGLRAFFRLPEETQPLNF